MPVSEPRSDSRKEAKQRIAIGASLGDSAHALPYELRINGVRTGRFDDLRDATASALIAKQSQPAVNVIITDAATQRLIIEIIE